eukprot:Hpha_TRINITY_DN26548_c0_g1::TRINITY_DN26548_c0_g1_i1::g.112855::m.112855
MGSEGMDQKISCREDGKGGGDGGGEEDECYSIPDLLKMPPTLRRVGEGGAHAVELAQVQNESLQCCGMLAFKPGLCHSIESPLQRVPVVPHARPLPPPRHLLQPQDTPVPEHVDERKAVHRNTLPRPQRPCPRKAFCSAVVGVERSWSGALITAPFPPPPGGVSDEKREGGEGRLDSVEPDVGHDEGSTLGAYRRQSVKQIREQPALVANEEPDHDGGLYHLQREDTPNDLPHVGERQGAVLPTPEPQHHPQEVNGDQQHLLLDEKVNRGAQLARRVCKNHACYGEQLPYQEDVQRRCGGNFALGEAGVLGLGQVTQHEVGEEYHEGGNTRVCKPLQRSQVAWSRHEVRKTPHGVPHRPQEARQTRRLEKVHRRCSTTPP